MNAASKQQPARRRVTVKDVAQEAGVAIGTVSRVIRHEPNVAPKVREKVEAAIEKLGWQPSLAAQSMRGVASRTIGFVFSDIRNPLYAEMAKGAEDLLAQYGYMLIVANSDGRPEAEQALIERFSRWNVEGMLFSIDDESHPEVHRALADIAFPFVMVERDHPLADAAVGADHYRGTLLATKHLLKTGHRRIAVITGGKGKTRVSRDRLAAYMAAHSQHETQVDETLIRLDSFSEDYGFREAQRLLGLPQAPTAILALGMRLIAGVLKAVRGKEVGIPDQLSLIASNDSDIARLTTPDISVIRYDPYALGREAAHLLMQKLIKGEDLNHVRVEMPTELVMRGSCSVCQPQS
ncbi:MAG: substrate-binding domain-containing protein [Pusillimonas sp.]